MAQTNRYSLADYKLVLTLPSEVSSLNIPNNTITIGGPGDFGQGSFVGQITISRNSDMWSTEGDVTGSWVHSLNLNRTGTISVDITQISDQVIELIQTCQAFESISIKSGINITLMDSGNTRIAEATDCYITKMPDQVYAESAQKQSWTFTCGRILYDSSSNA